MFRGVLGDSVVSLRQQSSQAPLEACWHDAAAGASADAARREALLSFLQEDAPWSHLNECWARADARLATVAAALPGHRVLRQDPVECLFSFICSSNNNIKRINMILQRLRSAFGALIYTDERGVEWHSFPSVEALAAASVAELRELGLGYRAKYIQATAAKLKELGGERWLRELRKEPDRAVVARALCQFTGVGPKVADCVALFSLDQHDVVPVDTHVWAIAVRDFDRSLEHCGSLTPRVYERVGDLFRGRFGDHAGWAHSLLFAAELSHFWDRLPAAEVESMKAFAAEERRRKQAQRRARKSQSSFTPPRKRGSKRPERPVGEGATKSPAERAARGRGRVRPTGERLVVPEVFPPV